MHRSFVFTTLLQMIHTHIYYMSRCPHRAIPLRDCVCTLQRAIYCARFCADQVISEAEGTKFHRLLYSYAAVIQLSAKLLGSRDEGVICF